MVWIKRRRHSLYLSSDGFLRQLHDRGMPTPLHTQPFRQMGGTMRTENAIQTANDNETDRRSLKRLLHSAGCILLDVQTPGMGGPDLQARLNRLGYGLPMIVMTAQGDP